MSRTRFAAFGFDTATGELWRDGRRVRLQQHSADNGYRVPVPRNGINTGVALNPLAMLSVPINA